MLTAMMSLVRWFALTGQGHCHYGAKFDTQSDLIYKYKLLYSMLKYQIKLMLSPIELEAISLCHQY